MTQYICNACGYQGPDPGHYCNGGAGGSSAIGFLLFFGLFAIAAVYVISYAIVPLLIAASLIVIVNFVERRGVRIPWRTMRVSMGRSDIVAGVLYLVMINCGGAAIINALPSIGVQSILIFRIISNIAVVAYTLSLAEWWRGQNPVHVARATKGTTALIGIATIALAVYALVLNYQHGLIVEAFHHGRVLHASFGEKQHELRLLQKEVKSAVFFACCSGMMTLLSVVYYRRSHFTNVA